MLIDLHTHTYPISDDSLLSPDQLITEAKRSGLDGICITDHDRFWDPARVAALSKEYRFHIFPGCEVTTEQGHLLVFGLEEYIFGMHQAAFVRNLIDKAGGAMIVAHPYRRLFREVEPGTEPTYSSMVELACENNVYALVDGIEVLNGRGSDSQNMFATEISKRFDIKGIGSSDAHRLEDIGTYATKFRRSVETLSELIHEIKAGNFQPIALNG